MNLRIFVVAFLFREGHVLLLERARSARFAPGKWTGVGGRVDPGELDDVEAAALREIREETGLRGSDLRDMRARFVVTLPEAGGITVLIFYAAETDRIEVGPCDEGTLHWIPVEDIRRLDMIDNARRVLDVLIQERAKGCISELAHYAVCHRSERGEVMEWAGLTPAPLPHAGEGQG